MYASFDSSAVHLMDPYRASDPRPRLRWFELFTLTLLSRLPPSVDSTDTDFVLQFLKDTFSSHYNGKRQPFGLYTRASASHDSPARSPVAETPSPQTRSTWRPATRASTTRSHRSRS